MDLNRRDILSPVHCPVSADELMSFDKEQDAHIRELTEKALSENRWGCAQPITFNPSDDNFLAYWLEKTRHPIVKPLLGHEDLQEHFDRFRSSHISLNGGAARTQTLSFVGDLMSTNGLEESCDFLYRDVSDLIFGADVSYANLESTFAYGKRVPLAFDSGGSPKINLNEEQYRALISHQNQKYTMVQLANNHILDCGENGISETVKKLDSDGVTYCGVNLTEDDRNKAPITEVGGLKIGWVAHTFSVNGRPFPEGKPWIVNMTGFHTRKDPDLDSVLSQISYCKEQKCDIIVAAMHWGLEFELYPHPEQMQWAQAMADAGADIIIGHHPHMIQYFEIVHPVNQPEKDVPVMYSLGNLSPVFSSPETVLSLIVRVSVAKENGKCQLSNLHLVPVAIFNTNNETLIIKKVKDLLELDGDSAGEGYISRIVELTDAVLGEDWRRDNI